MDVLAAWLRDAIHGGGLRLVYQPKVDASTRRLTGAEALLRWQHPCLGNIPPSSFVPAAEHGGLMQALGDWVVGNALAQLARWREDGLDLHLAINVSATQLQREGFSADLERRLASCGIPPSRLSCEITESVAVGSSAAALDELNRLDAMGVELSLDDFGVGHSSLSALCRLPVRELKLDRSFAAEIDRSERGHMAVTAAVHMAHALEMRVVAEGIENARQCRLAIEAGCDVLQGYHLSHPLEAADIPNLLRSNAPWRWFTACAA